MKLIICAVCVWCCFYVHGTSGNTVMSVAVGSTQFALELLQSSSEMAGKYMNIAISPFSVWSVLMLLQEGSSGKTNLQLKNALHLTDSNKDIRAAFRKIDSTLHVNGASVELDSAGAIFTDKNQALQWEFQYLAQKIYGTNILPVNFSDVSATVAYINRWVANVTHHRINQIVHEDDMLDPSLVIAFGLFFKGKWEKPFNSSYTISEKFYDDYGEPIGDVMMMRLKHHFKYSFLEDLEARVVELPYQGRQYSMFVMVPSSNNTLDELLGRLSKLSMDQIYKRMLEEDENFPDAVIDVLIPRVVINSDYVLNKPLKKLGIEDLFSDSRADLSKMSPHNLFLHKIIHKTEIVIDEEGTTASSATGGVFINRDMMPVLYANRPFVFFIVEKSLNLVMFAGKVVNPHM